MIKSDIKENYTSILLNIMNMIFKCLWELQYTFSSTSGYYQGV